ncbi:hypothetical protein [Streptomyces sp. TS71-3]|uniref:hypothetical protein n=1 Tax=Streptomyces sp. TS71-3 TaxID=2733862 RepID=UPI001B2BB4DF|nr:hypothetical protein [Streptomyces sp. TS71-3]GHJ40364.1 hypothetical protein Sm713_59730 [Streptomyces sp. TS71-3]
MSQRRTTLRIILSTVLLTVACALVPLAAVSAWAVHDIADTDTYVATMEPLAYDTAVKDDVANAVTGAIMTYLSHNERVGGESGGRGPLHGSVQTFVNDAVRSFTGTKAFRAAWNAANRATHDAVLQELRSGHSGKVGFDLAPISAHVKQQLLDDSVPFAEHIPVEHSDVTVLGADDLAVSRKGFRMLQVMGVWLPIAAVGCAAGGVLAAVRRRRAVAATALGTALGAAVLLGAIAVGRGFALGDLPPDVSRAAAGAVYDALTHSLWVAAWSILGASLAVAMLTYLTRRRPPPP